MCGIAGIVSLNELGPRPGKLETVTQMCEILSHRGPDDQGIYDSESVTLGMRRLAVIDINSGQQPMISSNKEAVIVFNGEIYNHPELRKELSARGYHFNTNSDTETLLNAYLAYGTDCLSKLRGMFAFAIWDLRTETLFIARDRIGKKPLFYARGNDGTLVFASELKALLATRLVERKISIKALNTYLAFGYIPEGLCIIEDAYKLPPGHFLTISKQKLAIKQYWSFAACQNGQTIAPLDYVEKLREKLRESVKIRLISDVPIGAFLSGGMDSSSIVASMSSVSNAPITTFSIAFEEASYDESEYAKEVAEKFGTNHYQLTVNPDYDAEIEKIVWHLDEPFGDSSCLPTYAVSRAARELVTVALSGDGGDELFAGYTRYLTETRRNNLLRLPYPINRVANHFARKLPFLFPARKLLFNLSLDGLEGYIDSISHFNRYDRSFIFGQQIAYYDDAILSYPEEYMKSIVKEGTSGSHLNQIMYLDSMTYLPGDILTKVDRMSMANSLEVRCPFLDHELIELVQSFPDEFKLKGSESKRILRKAMADILPERVMKRSKKGFAIPIADWIRTKWRDRISETVLSRRSIERGYFNSSVIRQLIDEHLDHRRDHSHSIWLLYMLELWHQQFIDTNVTFE